MNCVYMAKAICMDRIPAAGRTSVLAFSEL